MCDVDTDEVIFAAQAMAGASRDAIQHMRSANPVAFRAAFLRLRDWTQTHGQPFECCDSIADSVRMIWSVTQDNDVLCAAVAELAEHWVQHNRCHARDVL
jgi:hypothetical protein